MCLKKIFYIILSTTISFLDLKDVEEMETDYRALVIVKLKHYKIVEKLGPGSVLHTSILNSFS